MNMTARPITSTQTQHTDAADAAMAPCCDVPMTSATPAKIESNIPAIPPAEEDAEESAVAAIVLSTSLLAMAFLTIFVIDILVDFDVGIGTVSYIQDRTLNVHLFSNSAVKCFFRDSIFNQVFDLHVYLA